jgi:poly(hydroxyalkanoate) depolymerase family esterase
MSLSKTLGRLKRCRNAFSAEFPNLQPGASRGGGSGRLVEFTDFENPGNLRGLVFVPEGLRRPTGLLVVLHGCTQNAEGYDRGSGWSLLAERHGFVLLYPEQKRENNSNLCFNWYQRGDAVRGSGEAASIANMVQALKARHPIDGDRVFVTGLSAGGAMTSVMLATYPELFAGGAIIAGLPYGCAGNVAEAFECMAGRGFGDSAALANKVRAGSSYRGQWPRVSIWQGSADRIVAPANATALISQWTGLHGLSTTPDRVEAQDGHTRRVWTGREGQELIEYYLVEGMAHGTPLMPGTGEGQSGQAQAHMLDVGLSSTDHIAAFFGIGPEVKRGTARKAAAQPKPVEAALPLHASPAMPYMPHMGVSNDVQQTIENALRGAGLMK